MARKFLIMIAAFAALALAVPVPSSAAQAAAAQENANARSRMLTDAYNATGRMLFRQLSARPGNIVLSPFSIGSAMTMALSGARGATEREMASVLEQRLARPDMEAAAAEVSGLIKRYDKSAAPPSCPPGMAATDTRCEVALPASGRCPFPAYREGAVCVTAGSFPPSARLLTANALMMPGSGDLIAADYATLLRDKYEAEVFRNADLDQINGWVKRKTEGKIERILDRLDPSTAAVLLNAVYFKAKWAGDFSPTATRVDIFNLSSDQQISVPMMRRAANYALAARPGYRAVRMPYSVAQIAMIIALPDEIDGLDALSRRLDDDEWAALSDALHAPAAAKTVDLVLPRFKTSFDVDLVSQFRAGGMTRAFDARLADFSGMSARPPSEVPIAIGSIRHRATIEVMEDGTEAAAATVVGVEARAAPGPQQRVEIERFYADHPFLFAIIDDASGAVLFQGRMVDPR
jgi:serpin B